MAQHSFDTQTARRIVKAVQYVEAMPRPAGKPLRPLSIPGGGKQDESLRVVSGPTTEGTIKYWTAKKKTWTDGTIGEAEGDVWLFHFDQSQDLEANKLYHGRLYTDGFSIDGVSRALYGTVDCPCEGEAPAPPPEPPVDGPAPIEPPVVEPPQTPAPPIPAPGTPFPPTVRQPIDIIPGIPLPGIQPF